jgi:hypothetical protein
MEAVCSGFGTFIGFYAPNQYRAYENMGAKHELWDRQEYIVEE